MIMIMMVVHHVRPQLHCTAGSSPTSARASIDGRADGMFGSAPPTPRHEPVVVYQQQAQAMPFSREVPVVQQQVQVRGLWPTWQAIEAPTLR